MLWLSPRRQMLSRVADIKGEERRCIVRGESLGKTGLVRFVIAPDDQVVADVDEKLPGRGIWVSAERPAITRAVEKRLFARAARRQVRADADLADKVEHGLATRVISTLGLARRAGAAVAGYEKVRGALKAGQAVMLVEASDAAVDGHGKMVAVAADLPMIQALSASELGQAFGRERAVHVAILRGHNGSGAAFADRLSKLSSRLGGLRDTDSGPGLENVG